jgi:hypothetical protein
VVWSRNERQLAAFQQTPHCALRFWVVRGPKVCSSRAFDFVMIEDKSTGDSSFEEQGFKVFKYHNGRWGLCDAQQESAVIMGWW